MKNSVIRQINVLGKKICKAALACLPARSPALATKPQRQLKDQSYSWPSVRELEFKRGGERIMVTKSPFINCGRLERHEKAGVMTFLNGFILCEDCWAKSSGSGLIRSRS